MNDSSKLFAQIIAASVITYVLISLLNPFTVKVIPYSDFLQDAQTGMITDVIVSDKQIYGRFAKGPLAGKEFVTNRVELPLGEQLASLHVKFQATPPETGLANFISWLFWGFVILAVLGLIGNKFAKNVDGLQSGFLSIEKNRARVYVEDKISTTFADVAGVDEAIEELREVVNFLRQPATYQRLGGRLPRGVLLVGPPGTGKTLLARAVAGEAGVPFFSISGSEFVELFVGVGAARVRDLFSQARAKAPCIVFIDELDALGRSRGGNSIVGTHDEKEQTLNQLLVELDGFDTTAGIILLAATNRPEILDPALLRAGRFDRQVLVDRPDKKGRADILNVHMKKIIASPEIDVNDLAAMTPGFTGADLANIVNEAALLAARRSAEQVQKCDFESAIERVVAGLEKKNRILSDKERRVVAHHEIGHALVAMCLPGCDKVQKVSIIPRGIAALGYTVQRPVEDRFILSRTELENKLAALLGGRAAELLIFSEESTGAADDLVKATDLARAMVADYGMDPSFGLMVLHQSANQVDELFQQRLSQETSREVDVLVRALLDRAFKQAQYVLSQNLQWLESAAARLIHDETLSEMQILELKPKMQAREILCN